MEQKSFKVNPCLFFDAFQCFDGNILDRVRNRHSPLFTGMLELVVIPCTIHLVPTIRY